MGAFMIISAMTMSLKAVAKPSKIPPPTSWPIRVTVVTFFLVHNGDYVGRIGECDIVGGVQWNIAWGETAKGRSQDVVVAAKGCDLVVVPGRFFVREAVLEEKYGALGSRCAYFR